MPLPTETLATLPRRTRLGRAAAALVGGLSVAGFLYVVGLPCIFAKVLRVPCPGCGSTRSVICLLHGDLAGSAHMNPVAPVAAVLIGALGMQALASLAAHGDLRALGEGRVGYVLKRLLLAAAIAEIVVWIARFFGALGGPVSV